MGYLMDPWSPENVPSGFRLVGSAYVTACMDCGRVRHIPAAHVRSGHRRLDRVRCMSCAQRARVRALRAAPPPG